MIIASVRLAGYVPNILFYRVLRNLRRSPERDGRVGEAVGSTVRPPARAG